MDEKALTPEACTAVVKATFGSIGILAQHDKITAIHLFPGIFLEKMPSDVLSAEAVRQIQRYLKQPEIPLDLPVDMDGTEIHRKVWAALMAIPSGEVRTFGELGCKLHFSPKVISDACEENPLALYIPSHRAVAIACPEGPVGEGDPSHPVVQTKYWLLKHEGSRLV